MVCDNRQKPIGTVTEIHGPVAVIHCEPLPPQALSGVQDVAPCLFEVHQHLDDHRVRAITLRGRSGRHRSKRALPKAD